MIGLSSFVLGKEADDPTKFYYLRSAPISTTSVDTSSYHNSSVYLVVFFSIIICRSLENPDSKSSNTVSKKCRFHYWIIIY